MDKFTEGYITCALWSSMDNSDESTGGEPLDANYSIDDIHPDTLAMMFAECHQFRADNQVNLEDIEEEHGATDKRNGHDFWLTRNGHGAGFWDRGYGEVGQRLTDAAHVWGSVDLYVGDDGMIHQS